MNSVFDNKSMGFLIGFLSRQSRKYFEFHADKLGLHGGQMIILKMLALQDGLNQSDLSKKLQVDKAHIARAIKKLEDRKLVTRQDCENDSRMNKLFLTDPAKALVPQINQIYKAWTSKLGDDFSIDEKTIINSLLVRMCNNVEHIKKELV